MSDSDLERRGNLMALYGGLVLSAAGQLMANPTDETEQRLNGFLVSFKEAVDRWNEATGDEGLAEALAADPAMKAYALSVIGEGNSRF